MPSKMIKFKLEKETKNTLRYKEVIENNPPIVGTLYVAKWFLVNKKPETMTVAIELQGIDYAEEGKRNDAND